MIPTVHLNGTSAQSLLDQQIAVGAAARALQKALEDAAPNARDYYPQGDDAYRAAAREHTARCEAVRRILDETQAIALAISEHT